MTILEFLDVTTPYLAKYRVESPRLTAELLLAEVLQKKRMQLYLEFSRVLPEETLALLRPLVKRRAQGEPLQYVQGFAEFRGARFKVTPHVLIPRPETELLYEALVTLIPEEPGTLVDVGTGSGILALTLARDFPKHSIVAIDRSPEALAIAQENAEKLSNVTFLTGHLLTPWSGEKAQMIVANLPYLPTDLIPKLAPEVQREPHAALDGGADGLDLIRELITTSIGRTQHLALEIGEAQAEIVKTLLQASGYEVTRSVPDLRQIERIIIGTYRG